MSAALDALYLPAGILAGDGPGVSLSSILDFDHVVTIEPMRRPGMFAVGLPKKAVYAPEAFDPDNDSTKLDDWTLITAGLTGQHGYNGPWLHDSEVIPGGVARRILEHVTETGGGLYVAVYATYSADADDPSEEFDDGSQTFIDGWAIAYRAVEVTR